MSAPDLDKILGEQMWANGNLWRPDMGEPANEEDVQSMLDRMSLKEKRLYVDLPQIVGGIAITDIVHLSEGRKNPPRNLGAFGLVAIMPRSPRGRSFNSTGYSYPWLGNLLHWHGDNPPYIDATVGIGLTYDPSGGSSAKTELHAVSSAGISDEILRIVQLQGAIHFGDNPDLRRRSGLHQGILWSDTLVEVWAKVAGALKVNTLEIAGTKSRDYAMDDENLRIYSHYDEVAQRMGFEEPQQQPGNWALQLADASQWNEFE